MQSDVPTARRFVGFDAAAEAFLHDGRVYRGFYAGHGARHAAVLDACLRADLFRHGIVPTRRAASNPLPAVPYELVLEHERIPFVTCPHEWSASMLRDAALLHVDLFLALAPHGLTIKDWHPFNLLFRDTEPVFVDFASILPDAALAEEAYLASARAPRAYAWLWDRRAALLYAMYRRMFLPHFLLPLSLMHRGEHALARTRMRQTVLNAASSAITQTEVFGARGRRRRRHDRKERRVRRSLVGGGTAKRRFFLGLRRRLERLRVGRSASGYADYYEAKGEWFDFAPSPAWTAKQRVVHETLERQQPTSVLDLGCNTGWFSVLAARRGCRVLATDVDEACVDTLHARARREGLPILPLVVDLCDPTPALEPLAFPDEPGRSLLGGTGPLVASFEERAACDLVLALALVHHLVLGRGLDLEDVAARLARLARCGLVVEFVAREDPLVAEEPGFFPALAADPGLARGYALEPFVAALRRHFPVVDAHPSHPPTRTLLVCRRDAP